jgi:small subunit ribosomal protein S11
MGDEENRQTDGETKVTGESVPDAAAPEGAVAEDGSGEARHQARSRGLKMVPAGIAHVRSSFNNTIVTICDRAGAVIAWSSAGRAGFKGSRKSTAFAATVVAQDAARQAVARGMREVEAEVQGAGAGRESAIRALQSSGLAVTVIRDATPIPHNGCRPRKRRRV